MSRRVNGVHVLLQAQLGGPFALHTLLSLSGVFKAPEIHPTAYSRRIEDTHLQGHVVSQRCEGVQEDSGAHASGRASNGRGRQVREQGGKGVATG